MKTATDSELMWAVRAGRTSALATLFERHHTRLYRFCLKMTGDKHAAEDLVQDAFMRILKYRKSFRSETAFEGWMFRIARNACVDHLRHSALRPTLDMDVDHGAEAVPGADMSAADDERTDLVRRALMALPVQGREVLVLSRYEFKTYEEIARVLGCSVGAVKVRAHRAMKQLRRAYLDLSQEVST